jgi:hypothetical protein
MIANGSLTQGTIGTQILSDFEGAATSIIYYNFNISGPTNGTLYTYVELDGTAAGALSNVEFGLAPGESFVPELGLTVETASNGVEYLEFIGPSNGLLVVNDTGSNVLTIATPYSGSVASLSYSLQAITSCLYPCTGQSVNFPNTAGITGATVDDANGNPVPAATILSESGFNPNAVATSEPSSLLMLGCGLLALFGIAKRKGSRVARSV